MDATKRVPSNLEFVGGIFLLLAVLAISAGIAWYRAGVQQAVWSREGIELSRWEIMMGAEPKERVFITKPN